MLEFTGQNWAKSVEHFCDLGPCTGRPTMWLTNETAMMCMYLHIYVYIYIQNYIDTYPCARGCPSFVGLMINHGIFGAWEKSSHPPAPPRLRPAVFLDTWDPIAGSVAPMSPRESKVGLGSFIQMQLFTHYKNT